MTSMIFKKFFCLLRLCKVIELSRVQNVYTGLPEIAKSFFGILVDSIKLCMGFYGNFFK